MTSMIDSATKACEQFNSTIISVFPQFICKSVVKQNLGLHVVVEFANVKSAQECASGILMNASGHMRFMIHLCDNRGKELSPGEAVEIEILMMHYKAKQAGLKFRKIKGKTPEEAMEKLAAWFEKNKNILESI